jgi:isocitrate/isopropylmalate dehydrogenase
MILAGAALLEHFGQPEAQRAAEAIRAAALDAVQAGIRTADLRGHASTSDFTDAVIERTRQHLSSS